MLKRMISLLCAAALVFTSTGVVVLADEAMDTPIQIIEEQLEQPERSPAVPEQQPASEPQNQVAVAEQPKLLTNDGTVEVYGVPDLKLEFQLDAAKDVLKEGDQFTLYLKITDWDTLKENTADQRFFFDKGDSAEFYNSYGLDLFDIQIDDGGSASEILVTEHSFLPEYMESGKNVYTEAYRPYKQEDVGFLGGIFDFPFKDIVDIETEEMNRYFYKLHPLDTAATSGKIVKLVGRVRKSVSVEKSITYQLRNTSSFVATIGRIADGYQNVNASFNTPSATIDIDTIAPRVELNGDAVTITDAFLDEAKGVVINDAIVQPSVLDKAQNKYQVKLPEGSDIYQVSVADLAGNKTEKTFYPAALSGVRGDSYTEAGQDYRFTLDMQDGDELQNLSVKVGGVSLDKGDGYTQEGNTYTIPAAKISGKIEVTATYQKRPHSISIQQPTNGVIKTDPTDIVEDGKSVEYTITADEGYYIASYTINGETTSNSDQNVVEIKDTITDVSKDIKISAKMEKQTFTVTLKAPENAVVDGSLMQTVEYGKDVVFTVTPNEGYEFDSVIGGIYNKETNTLTVSAVKEDKEISISFKLKRFTVTLNQPENASVDGGLTKTVNYGEDAVFKVIPDEGYEFDSVSGGNYDEDTGIFTVSAVKKDQSVSIRFKLKEYVITIPEVTGAKITVETEEGLPVANGDKVKHGAVVEATVEAEIGYTIKSVSGFTPEEGKNELKQCGTVTVKGDLTVTAEMTAKQYDVSTRIGSGADKGAVGADKETAAITDTVTFTITPNAGKEVLSFSVNGESFNLPKAGGTVEYQLTEHIKEHQVTGIEGVASFGNKSYDIAISKTGNGVVSDTPDGTGDVSSIRVEDGADKTVYIKAAEGSYIASYTVNGQKTSLAGQDTAAIEVLFKNVTSNQELSVEFGIKSYRIKADAVGGSITGEAERTVNHGSSVSFAVKPDEGYVFDRVEGEGKYDPATNRLTVDSVKSDLNITVHFKVKTFTVALGQIVNGTLGEGQASTLVVDYGGTAEFTVLPKEGYVLDRLSVGKYDSETHKLTILDVKKDYTIDISFKVMTFAVTAGRTQHGTITLSNSKVDYNGSASAKIQAAEGYYIASYTVNGKTTENDDQSLTEYKVELANIQEDQRIDATFAIKSFMISAKAGENGAITIRPKTVSYGGSAEAEIAADEGYYIASYTDVDGQKVENADQKMTQVTLRFRNVKENKSVEATFAIKQYAVRIAAVNGTIDGDAAVTVNHGSGAQFQVRANAGYVLTQELTGASYDAATGILTVEPVTAERKITLTFTPAIVAVPTEEMETLPELVEQGGEVVTADLTASAGKRLTGAQLLEMLQAVREKGSATRLVFLTESGMEIGVPVQALEKLATAEALDNLAKFISGMNQQNAFAFGLLEERERNLGKGRLDESNARSITFNLNETISFGCGIDLTIPAEAEVLAGHPLYVYRSEGSGLTLKKSGEAEYGGERKALVLTEVENSAVHVVSTYQIKSESSHSSGSGSSVAISASEYWVSIKERAESVALGATILIRMQGEDMIPADVIAAFVGKDVTLEFERGNDSFAINGKQLKKPEQNRIYYRFLDLKEMYAGIAPAQSAGTTSANPETGGVVTVSIPQGAVNDIVPSDLYVDESGMLSDTESGMVRLTPEQAQLEVLEDTGVPFAAVLAAVTALLAGGTIFYIMKKQSTSRK